MPGLGSVGVPGNGCCGGPTTTTPTATTRRGSTSTGRRPSTGLEIDGREVNCSTSGGDGPARSLFVHGLGGVWQNWLLNMPEFMDATACVALGPARASATRRCRARTSRSRATRAGPTSCATRWDRVRGRGRQLDGRLRRRRAGDPLPDAGAASSCSSRRRASRQSTGAREPLLAARAADGRVAASARSRAPPTTSSRRPRLRRAALQRVVRYPRAALGAARLRAGRSARRTDGFLPALEALPATRSATELPEIELPDADRVGRATTCSSRSRTPSDSRT